MTTPSHDTSLVTRLLGDDIVRAALARYDAEHGQSHSIEALWALDDELDRQCAAYRHRVPATTVAPLPTNHCPPAPNRR